MEKQNWAPKPYGVEITEMKSPPLPCPTRANPCTAQGTVIELPNCPFSFESLITQFNDARQTIVRKNRCSIVCINALFRIIPW